jgi:long-chain fatty acid transport protein
LKEFATILHYISLLEKKMKKFVWVSLAVCSFVYAGGYKIPEVSTNAIALSAANVAHAHTADTAYYNPANMVFMPDTHELEADMIYINLAPVKYEGSVATDPTQVSINAQEEHFFIPSLNYVSPKLGENSVRIGLSVVVPGGLSKRWQTQPAKQYAQEFTLEVVEVNPTLAIPLGDNAALAVGFRMVSTSGVVQSSGRVSRDMTGDSVDMGYNLALSYRPFDGLELGATYRSQVNLTVEGSATLLDPSRVVYDGGASVTVPLPAAWNFAVAYTFDTQTTFEFVYERTMWSAYETLDFNYAGSIGNLKPYFDDPIAKNWKDTNAYRLGITQEMQGYTLMAGVVYDTTPVPDESLSFELPDSDALSVSFGLRYDYSKTINLGVSGLYSMRDTRKVKNDTLDGEFSNSDVLILSLGLGYKF